MVSFLLLVFNIIIIIFEGNLSSPWFSDYKLCHSCGPGCGARCGAVSVRARAGEGGHRNGNEGESAYHRRRSRSGVAACRRLAAPFGVPVHRRLIVVLVRSEDLGDALPCGKRCCSSWDGLLILKLSTCSLIFGRHRLACTERHKHILIGSASSPSSPSSSSSSSPSSSSAPAVEYLANTGLHAQASARISTESLKHQSTTIQKTCDSVLTSWYDVLFMVTFLLGCKKIFEEPHGKFDETLESPSNPRYLNKTRNLCQMFGEYLIFEEAPLKLSL